MQQQQAQALLQQQQTQAAAQQQAQTTALSNACTKVGLPSTCKITDLDRIQFECQSFGISLSGCNKTAVEAKEAEQKKMPLQYSALVVGNKPANANCPQGQFPNFDNTKCMSCGADFQNSFIADLGVGAPESKYIYTPLLMSRTCAVLEPNARITEVPFYRNATSCAADEVINYNGTSCHKCTAAGYELVRSTKKCVHVLYGSMYRNLPQPPSSFVFVQPFRNVKDKNNFEMFRPVVPNINNSPLYKKEGLTHPVPLFTQPFLQSKSYMTAMDNSGMVCAPFS